MKVIVNGENVTLDGSCTVRELLVRRELAEAPCAVEVNRALVPKREHDGHVLADGDQVEIVTLVGGG